LSTLQGDTAIQELGLSPDANILRMDVAEQEELLNNLIRSDQGDGVLLDSMQKARIKLATGSDAEQTLVSDFDDVYEATATAIGKKEAYIETYGLDRSYKDVSIAVGLRAGLNEGLSKAVSNMQVYSKAIQPGASLEDIAVVREKLLAEQESLEHAEGKAVAVQNIINKMSPNMSAADRGKLVGDYGHMFGKDDIVQPVATAKRRHKIDEELKDIGDDDVDTLLLKEIADGLDRLVTITTRKP